ncbi:hypothetical protein ACU5B6_26945 [Moritella viscosa]|uniref:hypothetical protein n=1 Tax=Moritella viscosa TaxID=80854 RepID=UPI0009208EAB|nr:hypothetical protein [Moritella viscosa]SHO15114.1 Nitrite reductase [NAD(P)H] large subunit [Moritella viscosa]SHO15419.1 Nitrite reductase [NAD(P)H] large subunit [Moritella viscosa]SHO19026.1 Nitrite reductase [NAD(P)H] large subunit [Moritella viscosa]
MKVCINNSKQGGFEVVIDSVNFGVFDQIEKNGLYSFFPRRTEQLTGDHYIAIGEALNKTNLGLGS